MSKYILHKEDSRHQEYNDWLDSKKTFSFADYYNPKRIHFGALRVFNDDIVKAQKGFGKHPHDNMEIISIPLEGSLIHQDNLGNEEVIRAGEIQVMSTGSGVFHSEYNHETDTATRFLQIWIYPSALNVTPHYGRLTLKDEWFDHRFGTFVAPVASEKAAMIHQDAYLSMGRFSADETFQYTIQQNGNGAYLYVIDGTVEIDGHVLSAGDALGISETAAFDGRVKSGNATLLVVDVPMNIQL